MEKEIISSGEFFNRLKNEPPEIRYPFGISSIDALTEGFAKGELITVTGYSGHGKTTLCQSFTSYLAAQEIRILWFSYEMTPKQFFAKWEDLPVFYLPKENKSASLDWIEKKIQEAIDLYSVDVVFIDHLHYIVDMIPEGNQSQTQIIGHVCRQLKQLAIKKNIAIFLITHTKQPKDELAYKAPDLSSIRDSSFIAQESDAVYAIARIKKRGYSSDEYDVDSTFCVLKQRHTGNMGKKARLTFKDHGFHEAISQESEREIKL